MRSLNQFIWIQRLLIRGRLFIANRFWGMSIHPTARISRSARLDLTYPKGIHIGERTYIAFEAAILSHDMTRAKRADTVIGKHCFIGARSLVLPGVSIGDGSIVAAGSIVTENVPPGSIVAGNPAKLIRSDIEVGPFGVMVIGSGRSPK